MVKKTGSWLLILIIITLVTIASLIVMVRFTLPAISTYPAQISHYLSKELNVDVNIASIEASWVQAKPQFKLTNVSVIDPDHQQRSLIIGSVIAQLDIIQSIVNRAPVFKHLTFDKLVISGEQTNNRWLTVLSPSDATPAALSVQTDGESAGFNKLLGALLNQSKVVFNNAHLVLSPQHRPTRTVGPIQFVMQNTRDKHQLNGSAVLKYYGEHSSVDFAIEAGALAANIANTRFNVYTKFSNISEQLLALNLWDLGVKVEKLSLDAQVWATFEKGLLLDVVGKAAINTLHFSNAKLPKLSDSSANFTLRDVAGEKHLSLSDIQLSDGDADFQIAAMNAIYKNTPKHKGLTQLAISKLDLAQVTRELLKQEAVSEKLKTVLQSLNLKGEIKNILLKWASPDWADFKLQGDLHKVSADSYIGAPSVSGVSGLLTMTALTGQVDLNAKDVSLYFPVLYQNAWRYQSAHGKVSWQIERNAQGPQKVTVNSQLLSVKRAAMQANGRFSLVLPLDKTKSGELLLMLGMRNNNIVDALSYVPPKIVSKGLNKWLTSAALAGELQEAGFILRSPLRKKALETFKPSVQMYFELLDSKINFDAKWPNYDANDLAISFMDGDLQVSSVKGRIAANLVNQLNVQKKATDLFLDVKLGLGGDLNKLYSKLKTKPAIKLLPVSLRRWNLSGKHYTSLAITVPLQSAKQPKKGQALQLTKKPFHFKLSSQVKNGTLVDEQLQINAKNITAKLAYDSVTGLQSNNVQLSTFGYPAKLSVVSKGQGKTLKTSVALSGKIDVKAASLWLPTKSLKQLQGNTKFDARFDFCPVRSDCNQLVINSDLQGVEVDLPKPWGKAKEQASKLQLVNTINKQQAVWRYNYADKVRGVTKLAEVDASGKSLKNTVTSIAIGGQRPDLVIEPGVHIKGTLDSVQLDEILPYLSLAGASNSTSEKETSAQNFTLNSVDLSLRNARFNQRKIKFAKINLQHKNNRWRGVFDTAIGSGTFVIPQQKNKPIALTFNTLLYRPGEAKNSAIANKQTLAIGQLNTQIQPQKWPNINLTIEKLVYNKRDIGRWSAFLAATKKGYKASKINAVIGGSNISGTLAFAHEQSVVKSYLELKVKGGNFGDVLSQLGYSKVLENTNGEIISSLSWRGYPWQIAQKNLNGRLDFSMNKGRIIEAGDSANFLRIFGILNLNTVIKRLQLDFSDLLKSGIAFDTVTAKYYLQNGIASSQEPLKLEGSSASVEMSGTINLAERSLEQSMQVAIPLTSNAPLAALLLATPQIAGIAFVVDKLLGKQLSKLTALRYQVSGSWLEPKISPIRANTKTR